MAGSTDEPKIEDFFQFNDTDNDTGGWCEAGEDEVTIKTFQTCTLSLIFLLGIVGNCLVIATFSLYRRHHLRSMTDIFLAHLALADLLLLLTIPLQVGDTYLGWVFSDPLCRATRASYSINTYSGLLLLACISVDRYLMVARAQDMLRLRRKIVMAGKMAAVGVWLSAVLLSLPEISFSGVSGSGQDAYCGMNISGGVKLVPSGAVISVFCLSFATMVTCYSLIGRLLWAGIQQRRGSRWRRQRTLKLMVALVGVFLTFQLPYTVVLSRKIAGQFCGLLLEYVTCTLAYSRCCLNPILYALVRVSFRGDVLRLVRRCARGLSLGPQLTSNMSPSAGSPTSPERSCSSNEMAPVTKTLFPK